MADTIEQEPVDTALLKDEINPFKVNVIADEALPGRPAQIRLVGLIGPIGPHQFIAAKCFALNPDSAIAIGEHMAAEGRRVKTSLAIPSVALPADFKL